MGTMGTGPAIEVRTHGAVRQLTLCRPDAYNTITPQLRDELAAALDDAQADRDVRVVLLDARGPAFCAGYGLDWSTAAQAADTDATTDGGRRAWDSAADQHVIGPYAATWAKLHDSSKPTLAAVQGWCIAGGTNIVFNAHLIVAAESARFGYPPSRVWGVPEAPWTWVARMGLQQARRYMLTGDEFTAAEALAMGVVLEVVPDEELAERAMALAQRIAMVPANQLQMITWALTSVADHQYDPPASRRLGTLFDGVARHSQEGADFVTRSQAVGFREAVRERDRPFRDYGERGGTS
jgi:enoyl-CoA hydratase